MPAISRRTALGVAAAGVVAAAAGATAVGSRACIGRSPAPSRRSQDLAVEYVDRDGWMMTPAEGERLPAAARTAS
jgi:hypothetical protein